MNMLYRITIYSLVFLTSTNLLMPAEADPLSAGATTKGVNTNSIEARQSRKYTRLDFLLKGASCVSCIRKVVKILNEAPAVAKADISLIRPHRGVIIFETGKSDAAKLESLISSERVKLLEVETSFLGQLPAIIIPRASISQSKDSKTQE